MPTQRKKDTTRRRHSGTVRSASDGIDSDAIQQVRRFNRTVAERIGVVHDRFLQQRRPMNEARLIWEIGPKGEELRTLRARLGLDSGYLTRVMGSLTKQGLVTVRLAKQDARVRFAHLTTKGLRVRTDLDQRSDVHAIHTLDVLTEKQRKQLTSAMRQVELLLDATMVQLAIEDPTNADAVWCFEQYFAELDSRFDGGFDQTRSVSAEAEDLVPPRGALVIARFRGQPVGCGALKIVKKGVADLKRMWVSPTMRGLGVGRRIAKELEQFASKAGVRLIRLETNRTLKEAIRLYRDMGYVEVKAFSAEPYAHHWFAKRLDRASR
ncbi:MAG TPA: helix-turn-helix domain-containing GNAT family N-acetyltransferase [Gemmatimonadaceae bacterium]